MKSLLALLLTSFCLAAPAQDKTIPRIIIGGQIYTNARLKVLNSTNAIITSGTSGKKFNLADLPEPWRAKYYDEKKVKREAEAARAAAISQQQAARAATQQAEAEHAAADKRKEAERAAAEVPEVSNEWIELSKTEGKNGRFGMTITGKLRSKASKHTLKGLRIRFDIFDAADNKIDTAYDHIATLEPGETWKFSASSLSEGGKTYRLGIITSSDGRLD